MLRTRLYLGLLPLLLVLVATGIYSIVVSRQLAGSIQRDLVTNYGSLIAYQQLREAAGHMNRAFSLDTLKDPLGARQLFDDQRSVFQKTFMDESLASSGTPRAELLAKLDEAFGRMVAQGRALFDAGGRGTFEMYRANESAYFATLRAIDDLVQNDYRSAQIAAARARHLAATTSQVITWGMIVAFVVSVLLAWRLADSLLKPIRAVTESAVALGRGDLAREVPVTSRDELGQLAKAFNTMAVHLRAYRDATMAKVLRTQRTMEATLTSAPDPVFVIGTDGRHEVRNPAAEQIAQSADFGAGFPPGVSEPLARVIASGEHYLPTDYGKIVTLRVAREDRHYLPRILAIGDKLTEFKGAAVILQDVTKFRLLDDVKTNLVGTVSHELKTPLTGLRMAVYLLLEQNVGALTPKQRELLESARDDADRLLRILDSLLDLARLEGGASSLERRPVQVESLLEEMAREARSFVEVAGQKLVLQVDPELQQRSVSVDAERIRHVFINLLANASKYSPVDATITLAAAAAPLNFVRFSVRDEGSGIPPESIGHVFERFYRAPGQSKTGAGLGLAIAREIVVAHGGSITCTSEIGVGTEFAFLLVGAS
jgi:NtrC-family two-component system sensor histidine kinase KinB